MPFGIPFNAQMMENRGMMTPDEPTDADRLLEHLRALEPYIREHAAPSPEREAAQSAYQQFLDAPHTSPAAPQYPETSTLGSMLATGAGQLGSFVAQDPAISQGVQALLARQQGMHDRGVEQQHTLDVSDFDADMARREGYLKNRLGFAEKDEGRADTMRSSLINQGMRGQTAAEIAAQHDATRVQVAKLQAVAHQLGIATQGQSQMAVARMVQDGVATRHRETLDRAWAMASNKQWSAEQRAKFLARVQGGIETYKATVRPASGEETDPEVLLRSNDLLEQEIDDAGRDAFDVSAPASFGAPSPAPAPVDPLAGHTSQSILDAWKRNKGKK